jgi:hypothetical protein
MKIGVSGVIYLLKTKYLRIMAHRRRGYESR